MRQYKNILRFVQAFCLGIASFLVFGAHLAVAQTFPAIVNLNIQPPYSPYLTDFLQPGQERIILNVTFLDQSEPSWDAKLRMSIEGNGLTLQTSRAFYQPVTLSPGPNLIDVNLLEQLMDFSKMDVQGTNKNNLVNAGRLPEGTYQFCVEVIDAGREIAFATPGCFTATLIQNNPPQLVSPLCGATISAASGQNIQFNWIPMHDPSISVRYEMKLVEVPEGMNVNDAINGTSFPILDWEPMVGTSFTYGPALPPLDLNKKYAFQIRVVDVMGLTTFENDGKAPVCWFVYGYSNDGTIDLTAPAHQARVDDPDKVDFAWSGPSNAVPGQQLKYHLKVVKLNNGERITNQANAVDIINRTQGVWYEDSTNIMPNIYGGSLTVEQPLEPDAYYAWQILSSTDGFKTAKSEIHEFRAPPVIYSFWVADGAYMITVTNTTAGTKVNDTKYTNLAGTGKVVLAEGEQPTEVSYQGLTVEMVANKWVLKVGEVVVPKTEEKALDFGDYGAGEYQINAWVLTAMEFLAQGKVVWHFPLSVNAPGNAVVSSAENVRLNYLNKVLSGSVLFADNQSFDLLIPMGFSVKYLQPSQFIVAPGGETTLKMYGRVYFPGNLKTMSGDPFSVPFEQATNPWYIEVTRQTSPDFLTLFSNTKMSLQPKTFVVDFSGAQSPAGIFSGDPEWVGVYVTEYNVFLPLDFDSKEQLSLLDAQVLTFVAGQPGFQPCWISSGGLNLDLTSTFEHSDAQPYYARINSFPGKFSALRLKIEDNSLSDSKFTGFIKVPFLDPGRKLDWTAPIAANGIQMAYFNEDSIRSFSRLYNKGDTISEVDLKINQAVFEDGNHLKLNVNLNWPSMNISLDRVSGLNVYGNGEIGFNEPNGLRQLTNQVPIVVGKLPGVADGIGAFLENGVYGFFLSTHLSFPGGLSSPSVPLKVSVTDMQGGPAPLIVYERVDGAVKSGKTRIGPIKVTMDNSLVKVDMFMDYIDDDPTFGKRFEAKGNLLVKQPDKFVAVGRLVCGESENQTKFWYIRAAAQGLNKPIEAYPSYHLNGFDFKIYHHLAKRQGSAFDQPAQMKDFWNIDPQDAANSIDGHDLNGNVALGMYGKIGVHDAASGRKQKRGDINITETLPSIGDILPEIPGFCDLKYQGKSICSFVRWPWEGLSICDLHVPYIDGGVVGRKSICEVDFFTVNWPNLNFCDISIANGKKLCDFSLGDLGFGDINICDIKLPNGEGICSYFNISGRICDIVLNNSPLCNLKLSAMIPSLPPFCEWKIPGAKAICNFKMGDIIPNVDLCDFKDANGQSIFCDWSWPNILPNLPNPCDLKLPNGTSLCSISADWCDIMVPVLKNGTLTATPLCQVKWWEINWPTVNPCEWTINGQSLCNLNINFCDLIDPGSNKPLCGMIPDFCDLIEPTTGKKFCELGLFDFDWKLFNFCSLQWPGTQRSICNLPSLNVCSLINPLDNQKPFICGLKFPDIFPSLPNFCDLAFKTENGSYKRICDISLDIEIPSICDLKLPNDVSFCTIKLPDFGLTVPNIPEIPGLPGIPENMYQQLLMGGLNVEVNNSGAISRIAVDGCAWFYTNRLDPNSSYLARAWGGVEFTPSQKKIEAHMTGEAGAVQTDVGKIKPFCGGGKVDALFSPNNWYIHVGKPSAPWEVQLACQSALSCSGFITANSSGILAHGEVNKHAETSGGFSIGIADLEFYARAHLDVAMEIGVSFDDPAIFGGVAADAGASAGVKVTSAGVTDDYNFASVNVSGNLNFKVDNDLCLAGRLRGSVSILGQGVSIGVGVKIKDGSVSFPENPTSCY